jgi:hypothetical protein
VHSSVVALIRVGERRKHATRGIRIVGFSIPLLKTFGIGISVKVLDKKE